MNNIELLVKHTGDVNFTRLDLFGDETISLTQVVQDVKDPGKVFTNFSKTFSLPASKTNNKFFKHYENFTQDVTYAFDARKKVQAKIELNSLPFQQGKLRLEGVDLKNGRPNIYRVTFFGSLNLKDILGDLKISDLDWLSNFDTTYTSSSLISITSTVILYCNVFSVTVTLFTIKCAKGNIVCLPKSTSDISPIVTVLVIELLSSALSIVSDTK